MTPPPATLDDLRGHLNAIELLLDCAILEIVDRLDEPAVILERIAKEIKITSEAFRRNSAKSGTPASILMATEDHANRIAGNLRQRAAFQQ